MRIVVATSSNPVLVVPGESIRVIVLMEDTFEAPAGFKLTQRSYIGLEMVECYNITEEAPRVFVPSDHTVGPFDRYVADLRAVQDYRQELIERGVGVQPG